MRSTDHALILALAGAALGALFACEDGTHVTHEGVSADAGTRDVSPIDADPEPVLGEDELAALAALSPNTLPAPPPDASNRFADDPRAARFGQKLFFETGFSGKLLDGDNDGSANALGKRGDTGKVSCAGCHVPDAGFLDNRTLGAQISLGAGWGLRRAPSLLDVGQAKLVMWDGRHDALYNQVFGPLESAVEMNGSRLFAAQVVFDRHRADYEGVFGPLPPLDDTTRFPRLTAEQSGCSPKKVDTSHVCNGTTHGMPNDGAEYDGLTPADQHAVTEVIVNVGKAIGAYERLLACGPGRFDAWMHGKSDALTRSERRGAQLFVGRGQCVRCHNGPFFSDQAFHVVGLKPTAVAVVFVDADDHGAKVGIAAAQADPLNVRGPFSDGDDGRLPTLPPDDRTEGAFRTPILRCVARRPSFMHTGQLTKLDDVVAFFARGGDPFGYFGTRELAPLALDARDQRDLVAFLGTLDGEGPPPSLRSKP
jgi:cytochrome c peroxidase